MTNAEARFNNSLRPRKPEGSLGRTAQDGHLDSHTASELCHGGPCAQVLTLDNWGHKTPTQSKRIKDRKEKIKGSWTGTCIQYTWLHYYYYHHHHHLCPLLQPYLSFTCCSINSANTSHIIVGQYCFQRSTLILCCFQRSTLILYCFQRSTLIL